MRLSQPAIFIGVIIFVASATFGQAVNPVKLKINGLIGLHSTYDQMIKALGKPASETAARLEQCMGGYERTVEYDGAMFYLMTGNSRDGKTFMVESFIVNGAKLTVSGVKVGDAEAAVKRKFGRRFTVGKDPETGARMLTYDMGKQGGPGQTTVSFKNGKVVRISSSVALC